MIVTLLNYFTFKYNCCLCGARAHASDCKLDGFGLNFHSEFNYLIFPFPRCNNEPKRGIEFRHSTSNEISRKGEKVEIGGKGGSEGS